MYYRTKFIFFITALFALPVLAVAGEYTSTISEVGSISTQYAFITAESNSPTNPACATELGKFAFDKTTPVGKALLVDALEAYIEHASVTITYDDFECSYDQNWLQLMQIEIN